MPIREKYIEVFRCYGDNHGEEAYEKWFNNCGESQEVIRPWNYLNPSPAYKSTIAKLSRDKFALGIQNSNSNALYTKILNCIRANNAKQFEKLLQLDFIYPESKRLTFKDSDYGDAGDWSDSNYIVCHTRHNCEALFIDKPHLFLQIINALLAKNNPLLYKAFFNGIIGSSLDKEAIYTWDSHSKIKIVNSLTELNEYGKSLKNTTNGKQKGETAKQLASSIKTQVINHPINQAITHQERLNNLKIKLKVLTELHHRDEIFEKHRGWKRFCATFFAALFSCGILNLIKYCVSGNGYFANKTKTQDKISKIHGAVELDGDDKMNFKLKA